MGSSIADVARLSGVSVATVSRALRDLPNVSPTTRDRVRRAAAELHYVADPNAARLAGQRAATVGLVVPMLSTWYHSTLFAGVEQACEDAGHDVLPYVVGNRERLSAFVDDLPFRKRVDGLVLADIPLLPDMIDRIEGTGVAVATCGPNVPGGSSLRIDDRAAAAAATQHLLGLGHERLAVIGGLQRDPFDFVVPHNRMAGVRDALAAAGHDLDDDLVLEGDYMPRGGARAMEALLARPGPRPTAVVALSDEMAFGAIHVARRAGLRVPQDLSVVGFDDHDLARYVDLTTIRQDVVGIGRRLVELLLQAVEAPTEPGVHERAATELVVRATTGPAPVEPTSTTSTTGTTSTTPTIATAPTAAPTT